MFNRGKPQPCVSVHLCASVHTVVNKQSLAYEWGDKLWQTLKDGLSDISGHFHGWYTHHYEILLCVHKIIIKNKYNALHGKNYGSHLFAAVPQYMTKVEYPYWKYRRCSKCYTYNPKTFKLLTTYLCISKHCYFSCIWEVNLN